MPKLRLIATYQQVNGRAGRPRRSEPPVTVGAHIRFLAGFF